MHGELPQRPNLLERARALRLLRRFEPSRLPAAASGPAALRVRLTMPSWTLQRSTDRDYVYQRFARLAERYSLEFLPADELRYLLGWNGHYLARRALSALHASAPEHIVAPRQSARGADVVFSYGVFPSAALPLPVVWEQTFAPQLEADEDAWVASWRARAAALAERATSVVTATEISGAWFARMFPSAADKIHVIPYYLPDTHTIDAAAFEAKLLPRPRIRILFVGREARRKGLVELTEAWHALDARTRDAFEVVVVSTMLDGPVTLPDGWQHFHSLPDLRAQFEAAQLFVFPSLQEAYGLVLVEAMSAGCMILTTSAPIQRSIVGDAGMFCDPRDPQAIAAALRELAADRGRIEYGMCAARARFSAEYAPASVAARYAELLWRSSGRSGSPPPRAA